MRLFHYLGIIFVLNSALHAVLVVNEPSLIVYETAEANGHIEDIIRYGTQVDVTETQGDWVYVTTQSGCPGWVLKKSLLDVQENPASAAQAIVGFRGAYVYDRADTEWGPFLTLPFETPLSIVEEPPGQNHRWILIRLQDGRSGYVPRSQITFLPEKLSPEQMVVFASQFIGTKYLWGGSTSFGYDCSGFVQMLYRQRGIVLLRNSSWQAADPRLREVSRIEARAGDLVFFKNRLGNIGHVGLVINQQEFIHASPQPESWICIASLDDQRFTNGNFSSGTIIKRFVEE